MNFWNRIKNFLTRIFFVTSEEDESIDDELTIQDLEDLEKELSQTEDRITILKRTITSKLYTIEQDITVFENEFPNEFKSFMERINTLREEYNSSLENFGEELTFEIDPDIDCNILGKINKLEKEVKNFIETEVKFDIISKRLQQLIMTLNIIYNVSINHSRNEDKKKVISRLEIAMEKESQIVQEFKDCYYILNNKQLKERIVNLVSYIDYQIFKTSIRNSDNTPNELIKKLTILTHFKGLDYISDFKDFIKDELSDLNELLPSITDKQCSDLLRKKINKLLTTLTYSSNVENEIFDITFWKSFFEIELSMIQFLKASGVEEDKAKIKIIDRMNISVNEKDVLVSAKTTSTLALTSLFGSTQDNKILLLLKMIKNLSNDITYKEIYFLLLLFEGIEIIKNNPNDLIKYIQKYIERYPYSNNEVKLKKRQVLSSSNKNYLEVFTINNYEENIVDTLTKLNIDFKVNNNIILVNSFYFNDLENVLNSFKKNMPTITI